MQTRCILTSVVTLKTIAFQKFKIRLFPSKTSLVDGRDLPRTHRRLHSTVKRTAGKIWTKEECCKKYNQFTQRTLGLMKVEYSITK